MALAGHGVLAIWNGIAEEAEADFLAWHVREHIPERVAVPGFLRGRRYVALRGIPRYFNFYETTSPADLSAPAYLARLDRPSDWTKRVVRHFRETSRTVCRVVVSQGLGDGACLATLRMEGDGRDAESLATTLEPLNQRNGIVGVHLLRGDEAAGGQATAEKALRDTPDRTASWVLLVEGVEAAVLEAFLDQEADALCRSLGLSCPVSERGLYRLQYGLGRDQLSATN
ncbi:DUF4286 family protein [Aureimonas jatrophae]|uniref:Uncharacterized protein n=1 Tax=Aureimonas jatrophae TaxID=1166073 RepID=A0A1H0MII4_9HYPH|nr:DUF4286 family protein [Aureimonas jatrophae]MBB3952948.1 hypothetical protein [Aureimonas jatrophae]SDO80076.1 hypothetical protein SAMN05192530_1149 [Aureimonas jatrophae]